MVECKLAPKNGFLWKDIEEIVDTLNVRVGKTEATLRYNDDQTGHYIMYSQLDYKHLYTIEYQLSDLRSNDRLKNIRLFGEVITPEIKQKLETYYQ